MNKLGKIFILLLVSMMISSVYSVKTVYRASDGEGIDQVIGSEVDEAILKRVDILESWLDVDGSRVYAYIKLSASNFPSPVEVRNSYRYAVRANLKSGNSIKVLEALLAINPGVAVAGCSLSVDGNRRDVIGQYEFIDTSPLTLKITCIFDGESFDSPGDDERDYRVVASVGPSTIGDNTASLVDILLLGKSGSSEMSSGESESPVNMDRDNMSGNLLSILPIFAIVVIAVAISIYLLNKFRRG